MIITEHAARRFVQRLAPSMLLPAARAVLRRASASATLLHARTYKGQHMWATASPEAMGAVLVCKHDPAMGLVVVTVLSAAEASELSDEGVDEVRAAFERASAAKEEQRRIVEAERLGIIAPTPREPRPAMFSRPPPRRTGKNKARQIAHEARPADSKVAAAARKAERAVAHQVLVLSQQTAKAERVRACIVVEARENSAVYFARWAGVAP